MSEPSVENFATLPDYLQTGLDIVLIGLNPSQYSVEAGHYFANPRNRFWGAFNLSGLVARECGPTDDHTLLTEGIGLTDVVKRPTRQGSGLKAADYRHWAPVLTEKLLKYQPRIACFQGLMAYKSYLRYAPDSTEENADLGLQPVSIGESKLFVVPNPSPANAKFSLSDLAEWFGQLKALRDGATL